MEIIVFLIVLFVYFLPSVIAHIDKRAAFGGIMAINIFLGWTIIGWIGALVWALTGETEQERKTRYSK
ncbi:MAG: superinfection immunity protein [Bacteroidales bacterium]|nr:superinfection immunity protein [Bacteroidales bacterium]